MDWKNLQIKKHLMTAISYLIPIVVGAGFMLAIGNIGGGETISDISKEYNFFDALSTMGGTVLGLLPMVIATGIAFSIADKPGIAPGMVMGLAAISVKAGFFGGLIGGFIAGWITKFIRDKMKVPGWAEGIKPMLLIPLISAVISGSIMYFIVGKPVGIATGYLENYLSGLNTSDKLIYGAIIGILSSIDYGGAINKVVFAFVLSLQTGGIYEPITVLMLASMVTPFGMAMAYFFQKPFKKNIYTRNEVETLKTAFPMGVVMITEGCFPIILNDVIRCVIATGVGGAIGGALSMFWGADSKVPHGGLLAMVTMTKPLQFFIALLIGSLATAIVLFILKKPVALDENISDDHDIDIDMSSIKIS
ncbi:PTS fructose transporter subunit IIC [Heyndrickxia acidiproducens]|uniref:PTS fructose transporter subunit IIC n=1 Tax=Heyndrickxia acidiproducens TaxID=1121084 RepID=UPI0003644C3C|nr:PTS fructose transporter subunit IIC [Heyndrickxia acidiproducens]